ncbi:hypothetical protein G6F40_018033 [Rhizopus arrhizus]|nr:hypothetical protein G6F40_018033 [Rhizopus arrhizus]
MARARKHKSVESQLFVYVDIRGEAVLGFAADAVAGRHDVGGLDHGQVELGFVGHDPGIHAADAVVAGADLRHQFHAARDGGRRYVHDDEASG